MVKRRSASSIVSSTECDADRLLHAIDLVTKWVDEEIIPGAGLLIAHANTIVAEAYIGIADRTTLAPVSRSTIWSVASVTKPFTAAVAMRAVEAGLVTLDEPIARWIPELLGDSPQERRDAALGRERITLRQCLSHSSGLPGFGESNMALRRRHAPLEDFFVEFSRAPQIFSPGTAHLYSNCGILLAAMVAGRAFAGGPEVSTNDAVVAFRKEFAHLLANLRMRQSALVPSEELAKAFARVEDTGQEGTTYEAANSSYYRSLGIPWGGLFTTPRDLRRWLRSFSTTASSEDRVLSAATIDAMTTEQAAVPDSEVDVPRSLRDGTATHHHRAIVEWGLGWEIKGRKRGHPSGDLTSSRTFGHLGATGTMVWVDPVHDVHVVLLTNRALTSGWTTAVPRQALFSNAVMAAFR